MAYSNAPLTTIASTTYQRNIGLYHNAVIADEYSAVIIAPHGRPVVVLLSVREWDALREARRQLFNLRLERLTQPDEVVSR